MATDLLDKLNPQQRDAVTAGDGPVLVLAGPGSGKTRVLTHRIAYLVSEMGVYPNHIVAVTFTNKAAAEMRARVEKLLGGKLDGLMIGTFHSICARLLRIEADYTPYTRDFVIYDSDDQQSVIKTVLAEMNVDSKKFPPGRVLNAISAAKNELIEPEEYRSQDYFTEVVARAYPRYQDKLRSSNALDFDDLLTQTFFLLRDHEAVRHKYQRRYEYVLVDEFQDTNSAQFQLVRLWGEPQNNVFVVGDEDQGIYAFRGADFRNVQNFRRDYPGAKVVLLEQNYRSTQIVLDTARAIIDRNQHRTPKALFTDRKEGSLVQIHEAYSEGDEGEFIVRRIREAVRRREYDYKDFAVMYRVNAQSAALEKACVDEGVPYKLIGGVRFYGRREIRDLLAYLRVINNPNDLVSFTRIVNVPKRGIGQGSVDTFLQWATARGITISEALDAIGRGEPSPLVGKAARSMAEFARLLERWRGLMAVEGNHLVVLFDELVSDLGYTIYATNELSETTEQAQERMENIQTFRGVINERKDLALNDFLTDIALIADVDSLDESQNAVTLLTLHAAKGLEFPVVFITGLEDGLLPHSRSFDDPDGMAEERRLLYVGLTRAKDHLYLSYAFRRALYGESMPGLPSRFLGDIPASLTEGGSVKMRGMQERGGYQKATTWERDSTSSRGKVIQFPGTAKPADTLRFRPGARVRHAKFGEGIVIDSERSGLDEEVTIQFAGGVGIKRLAASFANLVLLG